jgi:hypothetical protein
VAAHIDPLLLDALDRGQLQAALREEPSGGIALRVAADPS